MTPLESRWAHLSLQFGPTRDMAEMRNVDVVDEFNGPLAMFAHIDEQRLFGIAVDLNGTLDRWVFAPVDSTEEAAIRAGEMPLRNALRKVSALVIDVFLHGGGFCIAPVNGGLLDDPKLPDPGARLRT